MSLSLIIGTALLTAAFNPPEYLAPGVYVEEISAGPKSIEGVATSTCAAGITTRGPRAGRTRLVEDREMMRRYRARRSEISTCPEEPPVRRQRARVERSRFGSYPTPH